MDDILTDKQRRYPELLASGMPSRAAARGAGFSDSYAKVAAHRLGKKPAVAKAIQAIRTEAQRTATYGLLEVVQEIDKAVAFGYEKGNPMSVAKLLELKSKLFGLLIDRVEMVTVDLKGSLEQAKTRVIDALNIALRQPAVEQGPVATPTVSDAGFYYGPGVKGNVFGDD